MLINVALTRIKRSARTVVLLGSVLMSLSGCAILAPTASSSADEPIITPQLPPDLDPIPPAVDPGPAPPPVVSEPEPEPEPIAVPETLKISVILSSRTPAYESVANELSQQLDRVDIYDLGDKSLTPKEMYDSIRATGTEAVVAIGFRAAMFAKTFDDIPVVFSQVFNVEQIGLDADNVKGVSVLPPLELQIQAWRAMNPNLSSVGAILGSGHDRLIEEAFRSADQNDVRFQYRIAQSDRETLYLFTRLVPDIDGFWLFPDNRILSTTVLRQMLTYAARHRVQVAVFNDSLLTLGATISTTSVESDVAETIVSVASQMIEEGADSVPMVTPLNDIQIRPGPASAEQLASDARDSTEGAH